MPSKSVRRRRRFAAAIPWFTRDHKLEGCARGCTQRTCKKNWPLIVSMGHIVEPQWCEWKATVHRRAMQWRKVKTLKVPLPIQQCALWDLLLCRQLINETIKWGSWIYFLHFKRTTSFKTPPYCSLEFDLHCELRQPLNFIFIAAIKQKGGAEILLLENNQNFAFDWNKVSSKRSKLVRNLLGLHYWYDMQISRSIKSTRNVSALLVSKLLWYETIMEGEELIWSGHALEPWQIGLRNRTRLRADWGTRIFLPWKTTCPLTAVWDVQFAFTTWKVCKIISRSVAGWLSGYFSANGGGGRRWRWRIIKLHSRGA